MICAHDGDSMWFMEKCTASQFSTQFRKPITEVLSLFPQLLEHVDDDGYDIAVSIENNMYKMLRNVNNVEIFGRLEKEYFNHEVLDIVDLVLCVKDAVNSVCRLKINVDACTGPIYVEGNRAIQIHTLLGLIRNAFCYAQDHGSVTISIESAVNRVIVKVHDIGKGILAENQAKVFDPFFSADPYGDSTDEPGLGLDLAILERLQQHLGGGRPIVSSEFGNGSIIAFSVPVLDDAIEISEHSIVRCEVADLVTNRYSSLYLQLSGFCRYPG